LPTEEITRQGNGNTGWKPPKKGSGSERGWATSTFVPWKKGGRQDRKGRNHWQGHGVEKGVLGNMKANNFWQKGLRERFKEVWQGQPNSRKQELSATA